MEMIFENLAVSDQQSAISQIKVETRGEKIFDMTVIRQSNGTFPFVCNKSIDIPGWGLKKLVIG